MIFSIHQMIFSEKFANLDNLSNFANVKVVQNGKFLSSIPIKRVCTYKAPISIVYFERDMKNKSHL